MNPTKSFTLRRWQRLKGHSAPQRLFEDKGRRSATAYPVRAVFTIKEQKTAESSTVLGDFPVRIMVSVSKRHFKHAVDRNRVKRQVREAFRLNNSFLTQKAMKWGKTVDVAFIWLDDKHRESKEVSKCVKLLLSKIEASVEQA